MIFILFFCFERYDTDRDKSLNFDELKLMMEKLGIPQTHLSLKDMIKQVDEDRDGKISFREVKKIDLTYLINCFICFFKVFINFSKSYVGK